MYRGYEIFGMNMPTSGGAHLILMLNILELVNTSSWKYGSLEHVKTLIDIMNIAFADRNAYMGDSDFQNVPTDILVSKAFAAERFKLLPPITQNLKAPVTPGTIPARKRNLPTHNYESEIEENPRKSTTHFSIVDKDRNVVSVTSSLEQLWGSGVTLENNGLLLNNELTDFNIVSPTSNVTLPNDPETRRTARLTALSPDDTTVGGKRPRSSMAPTIIKKNGKPYLALGSPGGSRIAIAVFMTIVNHIDLGMDIHTAVNKSRIFARGSNTVEIESPLFDDAALKTQLTSLNYTAVPRSFNTAVFAVLIDDKYVEGVSDNRYPILYNYLGTSDGNEPYGY
jgi:gamma-glutamyltranspeptidase/glutathione hydrolase